MQLSGREPKFKDAEKSLKQIIQLMSDMIREFDLDIVRIQEQEGAGRHYICLASLDDTIM
jgi:hypothetical protein